MRILIADDHQMFREGLKRILSEEQDLALVGEAGSAQDVVNAIESDSWDIVVLDINLPGRNGIEVLKEIKLRHASLPVLILSMYPSSQYGMRAIRAGASGYLTKSDAAEELIQALRKIKAGGKYIGSDLADALAEGIQKNNPAFPHELLSDREYEVFHHLATGKTVGEIAEELNLSVKTVSTHRTHILEKLNSRNNSEIVQYAMNQHLLA